MSVRRRSAFEVPCTVEIETSARGLHAHVELDGVDAEPGDRVQVHDAPIAVPFGRRQRWVRRARVIRAGRVKRALTRLSGLFELGELFEVGFSPRRNP